MLSMYLISIYLSALFRLNYIPSDDNLKPEEGGVFQKFEEELEINDFPQQARYMIIEH